MKITHDELTAAHRTITSSRPWVAVRAVDLLLVVLDDTSGVVPVRLLPREAVRECVASAEIIRPGCCHSYRCAGHLSDFPCQGERS
jgi:hypothetical protein